MNEPKASTLKWLRDAGAFLYPFVRPDRSVVASFYLFSLVMAGANAILIWTVGHAVSQIASGDYVHLKRTLLVIGIVVLFSQAIQFSHAFLFQSFNLRFIDRVRGQMLAHIMRVSYPILSKFDKGDLIVRLGADVDSLLAFVVNIPLQVFSNAVVVIVYGAMLLWIDWRLALVAASIAPIFFISQRFVAPRTGAASRHFVKERARLVTVEEQALSNLRGISAFNGENVIRGQHQHQFDIARAWALQLRRIRVTFNSVSVVLIYFAGVVVVYSGISSIQSGHMPLGALVSFLAYVRFLVPPVRGLARIPTQIETNRVSVERVMQVMQQETTVANTSTANLVASVGRIAFEHVTFAYPNSARAVFTDLSLAIEGGESVALVGPSGSGKSTFAGLLLRFFDPQHGSITIDGTDIRNVAVKSLREHISIVWQAPYIFDGTIRANLLLAKPEAPESEMVSACVSSYAWEFIEKLDDGLDTIIGTNGVGLSVGQVQRLAIAQAFLRDTPIMILDEASSALDSQSEKMVVEALRSLRENRTTLMIAHRYSTIRSAHRVIYFNGDGSISTGTHMELMVSHPQYQHAVAWQIAEG